jgi:hypothetical protein
MVIDTTILNQAANLVNGERQAAYGSPDDNLWRIAGLWSAYLDAEVTAEDVCNMMVLVKMSRGKATYKKDNSVDGVAYLLLADMFGRYDGTK